jgi:hypothetical protein
MHHLLSAIEKRRHRDFTGLAQKISMAQHKGNTIPHMLISRGMAFYVDSALVDSGQGELHHTPKRKRLR